jgi:hypothetical protein
VPHVRFVECPVLFHGVLLLRSNKSSVRKANVLRAKQHRGDGSANASTSIVLHILHRCDLKFKPKTNWTRIRPCIPPSALFLVWKKNKQQRADVYGL